MSELTDKLRSAGEQHKGTELGGLLQWAALHIDEQAEALGDALHEALEESAERIKLENALHAAKGKLQDAMDGLTSAWCPPVDFGRDLAPHINLMRAHGDPDYTTKGGQSVRHVDTREARPRKKNQGPKP